MMNRFGDVSASSQCTQHNLQTQTSRLFNSVTAGAALASSFIVTKSVTMYLSIYVCLQDLLPDLDGKRLGRF